MGDGDDENVEVLRNYTRRRPDNRVLRVKLMRVPESEKFPEGVKYRLHYGTMDNETILRYDNSHGVHERHPPREGEEIEFPGLEALYERFLKEIRE